MSQSKPGGGVSRQRYWTTLGGFLAVGLWLIWEEHQVHLLGALPWLLLALCPLMHLFMHRGHGGDDGEQGGER